MYRCVRLARIAVFVLLAGLLSGCPVTQPQDTPVPAVREVEPETGRDYRLYVPSVYDQARAWPLVVTLHGTHGWDSSNAQIKEWKALAEDEGFIVVAPSLRSVQGILPVVRGFWYDDLAADEKAVLAIIDEVSANYNIDSESVLLTGFSAGGYPLYYIGLRNPHRFNALIARACNSHVDIFERIELTDEARKVPLEIFWGKDDLKPLRDQSWAAFRYLREHGFRKAQKQETKGGHFRRPEMAHRLWQKHLPKREQE